MKFVVVFVYISSIHAPYALYAGVRQCARTHNVLYLESACLFSSHSRIENIFPPPLAIAPSSEKDMWLGGRIGGSQLSAAVSRER